MRIVKADTIDKAKKIIFDEENVKITHVVSDYWSPEVTHLYYLMIYANMQTGKILASYNTETKEMVIY